MNYVAQVALGFRDGVRSTSEASAEGLRRAAKLAELWRARTEATFDLSLISAALPGFISLRADTDRVSVRPGGAEGSA